MHAHRQDMMNVELTVEEVRTIIEQAIVNKYAVLDNTWDLQDAHFHEKNLNSAHGDAAGWTGVTFFFTKDIEVEDAPKRDCDGASCGKCLNSCR